jgi:hypothetical protein
LHHVGSLYILTYDARKIKHKIYFLAFEDPSPDFVASVCCLLDCTW